MGDKSFWELCFDGDVEAVKAAIENGADVNEANAVGGTGLMYALNRSHNDVVRVLLQLPHIEVNKVDGSGLSALHHAVASDNQEGLELLLAGEHDVLPSINHRDNCGRTPIMLAVFKNAVNCFQLLLTNPLVDLDIRDNHKRTPEEIRRYV